MSAWTIAALLTTAAFAICGITIVRGSIETRLVALPLASTIAALDMLAIAQSFGNESAFDVAALTAILSLPATLVFASILRAMALIVATLAIGAGIVALLSSLGLLAMRTAEDRLHYLGPAATIGPLLLAIAIVIEDGFTSQAGLKGLCVAAIVIVTSPFAQYALLRAIVTRRNGSPDAPTRPELQR